MYEKCIRKRNSRKVSLRLTGLRVVSSGWKAGEETIKWVQTREALHGAGERPVRVQMFENQGETPSPLKKIMFVYVRGVVCGTFEEGG